MQSVKVDLLSTSGVTPHKPARTGRSPVKFFLSTLFLFVAFVGCFGYGRASQSQTGIFAMSGLDDIPLLGQMRHLIGSADRQLQGEGDNRINILLLGTGGEGHEGPNLTDTIMVASIEPKNDKVALLSIPRDLLVPLPKYGWRKINAANAFGEMDSRGHGADFARTALEGLLGIDIPYYVRVDFAGFKSVVDSVGGIDVSVDKSFTDYTYPTNDYGVQVVSFKKGWTHMTGEEALKFTRSRHGNNGEGSDFARAARQQKVLSALKDKLLTASTFKSPTTVTNTMAALQSNIATNLQIGEILRLARVAQKITPADIVHKVVDAGPDSPLAESAYGGAYVLVPRNDDWGGLRTLAADVFRLGTTDVPPEPAPSVVASSTTNDRTNAPAKPAEKPRVEIQNGSGTPGQAQTFGKKLIADGFQIVKIGNADSFDYSDSVIFDLTQGKKGLELAKLKSVTNASKTKAGPPGGLAENASNGVDFVFVIGKNAL